MSKQTEFSKNVMRLIKLIPKGKVATYGLIAQLAGNPRGARGVGWLLHSCTQKHNLPWQRVIKSSGLLPFEVSSYPGSLQKTLLEKENIVVNNNRVDLIKYLWKQNKKLLDMNN